MLANKHVTKLLHITRHFVLLVTAQTCGINNNVHEQAQHLSSNKYTFFFKFWLTDKAGFYKHAWLSIMMINLSPDNVY